MDTITRVPRLKEGAITDYPFVIAESASPLFTAHDPRERPLMLGKIENLRVACRYIHHCVLNPGEIFSFWRQVGPPWRLRGFVPGREVREGCVIPTTGGGLCQLSGSLLELAISLKFEVIERHRHTSLPVDIRLDARRDATLFWNYVDLRFHSPLPVLFESYLTEDSLIIKLRGKMPPSSVSQRMPEDLDQKQQLNQLVVESCFSCTQTGCMRHHPSPARTSTRP